MPWILKCDKCGEEQENEITTVKVMVEKSVFLDPDTYYLCRKCFVLLQKFITGKDTDATSDD